MLLGGDDSESGETPDEEANEVSSHAGVPVEVEAREELLVEEDVLA